MLFSSLVFLLLFLPVFYLIYVCVPQKAQNAVLLLFSLIFYAWGEPVYVLLMLGSILWNYLMGRLMGAKEDENPEENIIGNHSLAMRKVVLAAGITGNLIVLAVMKYADMLIGGVNLLFGSSLPLLKLALPIGISFYTFQTISYLVDVYRGTVKPSGNLINFGTYVSMFSQLIAGPIVRYETVEKELNTRKLCVNEINSGVFRFCVGLSKKVLIANEVGAVFENISHLSGVQPMALSWLSALSYTLQIYFDFSGYSDMAIGLGLMMGFHFNENFDYPYKSKSITEFWRRWHISLSSWFREYVYIPLGGNRVSVLKHIRNILIVWTLTGLWHGACPNFLLWGLYYGTLLLLEKYVWGKLLEKLPGIVRRIYTLLLVIIGWVIFANTESTRLLSALKGLIGLGGVKSDYALYLLKSNWIVFLAAIVLSFGAFPVIKEKLTDACRKYENVFTALKTVFAAVSLLACIALLLRGSYNPFLYFRF